MLRFVITFVVTLAVVGLLYAHVTANYHDKLDPLMEWTAVLSGSVASLFSSDVSWEDKHCQYRGFTVQIIDECTGLLEMVIFFAAVISFSTGIKKKLLGLAMGIPAIYVFNLIRIVVLMVVGASSQRVFDFMHLYFWQATLIIMIATVWIGWLYLVVYREKKSVVVST